MVSLFMKRKLVLAVLGITVFANNLPGAAAPARHPLPLTNPLADKNFYLLSLFQQRPELRKTLAHDTALAQLAGQRAARIAQCKTDSSCIVANAIWTDQDANEAAQDLASLYTRDAAFRNAITEALSSSGAYALYDDREGSDRLKQAWLTCVRGMNEILSVYGQGHDPRYPKIDAASIDVHSTVFQQAVADWQAKPPAVDTALFFEPALQLSLRLLLLNHRDEAARFEPIEAGENRAALEAIRNTNWDKYPYSMIIVPGAGPDDYQTALSSAGRERVRLAAQAFREGKAPFVLLTGGYVHPSQTHFAEAIEMKKALEEEEHIPESSILVDPFARHTTTNLRNAVREIYWYNIPMTRPALIVTDPLQNAYILTLLFSSRCQKELGYIPFDSLKLVSATESSFLPKISSLEQDPIDPLDP